MERRDALRWIGTAGTLLLTGCLGDDADDGMDPEDGTDDDGDDEQEGTERPEFDDPVAAVEAFFGTFDSGEAGTINAFIHDDAPLAEITPEEATQLAAEAPELEEGELLEEDDGRATVEVLVSVAGADVDDPVAMTVELRIEGGTWSIWDIQDAADEITPQAAFDLEFENGELVIVHVGGDAIPADELYVRGEGIDPTGAWHELDDGTDGTETVQAGDSTTVGAESEYSVALVWDDGNTSAVLAQASGTVDGETETGDE